MTWFFEVGFHFAFQNVAVFEQLCNDLAGGFSLTADLLCRQKSGLQLAVQQLFC